MAPTSGKFAILTDMMDLAIKNRNPAWDSNRYKSDLLFQAKDLLEVQNGT
jgi:hypothetical protein